GGNLLSYTYGMMKGKLEDASAHPQTFGTHSHCCDKGEWVTHDAGLEVVVTGSGGVEADLFRYLRQLECGRVGVRPTAISYDREGQGKLHGSTPEAQMDQRSR